jgi:nitrite reductase (NADH) small subunit
MAMTRHQLVMLSELPRGEGRSFEVSGRRIAVFRTRADELFATQAECPHKQGPLADGLLGGHTLICPLHEYRFDLTSGACESGPCKLEIYPASRGADDRIEVELPDS